MIKLFAIPMICSVMSGPVMKDVSYHHEYGPQQAVVYNDESYEITLSADELNNYTWESLYNCFLSFYSNEEEYYPVIDYNEQTYHDSISDYEAGFLGYQFNNQKYIYFYTGPEDRQYQKQFYYYLDGPILTEFEYDLIFTWNSTTYSIVKTAIQADIQANQTSSMPSIQDLFAQVTSAINAFIGSLGDAFTQVTALFWDSTAATPGPTFLGLLVLIGVGVGLVYAAYRVIKGLLHRI